MKKTIAVISALLISSTCYAGSVNIKFARKCANYISIKMKISAYEYDLKYLKGNRSVIKTEIAMLQEERIFLQMTIDTDKCLKVYEETKEK